MHCFECGSEEEVHLHHIIPEVLGGTKKLPMCVECHGKIHNLPEGWGTDHSHLTKVGMQKAKDAGKHIGRPKVSRYGHLFPLVRGMLDEGRPAKDIRLLLEQSKIFDGTASQFRYIVAKSRRYEEELDNFVWPAYI